MWTRYIRGVEAAARYVGIAAEYLLLVVLGVLIFPIFARNTDVPTIWALETAQFAVGAYYILGAGYSLQQGAHVRMDFLYANWKPRTQAIVDSITSFFVLFYLVIMLIGGWESCAYAVTSRQVNHTVWAPYMAPIKIAMEIGIFFMFLQMTAELIKSVRIAFGKAVEPATEEDEEGALYTGRATRRQFFTRTLLCAGVAFVGAVLLSVGFRLVTDEGGFGLLALMVGGFLSVAAPLMLIPVFVRRLHDLDMSGWWAVGFAFFGAIPGFGLLVLIGLAVLMGTDGAPGTIGFGPDAKGRNLIKVFDPRVPKAQAPIPEAPLPHAPEVERSVWLPRFIFAGIGAWLLACGYALSVVCANPTWFVTGFLVFAASFLNLIRGALCANH